MYYKYICIYFREILSKIEIFKLNNLKIWNEIFEYKNIMQNSFAFIFRLVFFFFFSMCGFIIVEVI